MTFLHTADWQLGKPFARIEDEQKRAIVRQERIAVLGRLAVLVQEQQAEFVIVAGDLFDSPSPDKATVSAACAAIGALKVPVYAIPGNHDHGGPGSVWEQPFFVKEREALAPNLTLLLKAEPVELASVVLLPCPLMHRHESGDTTAWLRTLDLSAYGDKARIVLAHGTVQDFGPAGDDEDEVGANNHLDLARLPHEQFDYIALGDWHGMKQISAKAWYSGTPEPDRFPRGVGNLPGHVLAVTLRRGEHPLVTPLATGRLRWHDLDHVMSDDGGLSRLYEILDQEMALGTGQDLLRLTLSGSLGMIGMTDLEACLETWRARLLRLRLHDRVAIAASDDEITALTQRADAPLIARVAAQLLAQSHSAGEQAEAAKNALRQLHAAALA